MKRLGALGWWGLAWICLALAALGVVLPGLPTTPFVLLAAWAAARGSPRLHARLLAHPTFGPMIRDWQREHAVARRAKWAATLTMLLCALILFALSPSAWPALIASACMAAVALWLWLRPEPRGDGIEGEDPSADRRGR